MTDVESVNERCATCRREQSRQHGHGRRFARPVVAQQNRYLTSVHVEVDVVNGQFSLAVLFGQPFDLDASVESDRFLLDELDVARRRLGPGQGDIPSGRRTAAPVISLDQVETKHKVNNKASVTPPTRAASTGRFESESASKSALYRQGEVPGPRHSEFARENRFDVQGQHQVEKCVDTQHSQHMAQSKRIIRGNIPVQISPLNAFACKTLQSQVNLHNDTC